MTVLSKMSLLPLIGMIAGGQSWEFDSPSPTCAPLKTSTDNEVLLKCASVNTNGQPFGTTQKQTAWVTMCSEQENKQYLNDLKLSITNQLFGGYGQDGDLTSQDCTSECVYSFANKDIAANAQRTVNGITTDYSAYMWNDDNKCWSRTTANNCMTNYEMTRYMQMPIQLAMTWRFPAFKVLNFCAPTLSPTYRPTLMPTGSPVEPPVDTTWAPSVAPTLAPSASPSQAPTLAPSTSPTTEDEMFKPNKDLDGFKGGDDEMLAPEGNAGVP